MRPVQLGIALAMLLVALVTSSATAADPSWQRFALSEEDTSQQNGAVASASDGTGRTTVTWVDCRSGGTCQIVARTRSAGGTLGARRVLSAPGEDGLGSLVTAGGLVVAANPAGDVSVAWPACGPADENGTATCGVRFAVRRRGLSEWTAAAWATQKVMPFDEPRPAHVAITLNDEGDVTAAWDRVVGSFRSVIEAVTLREEAGVYEAEALRTVATSTPFGAFGRDVNRLPLLTTRTDGTVVAVWSRSRDEDSFTSCTTVRVATQTPDGTWTAARPVDVATCPVANDGTFSYAIARDGDGALVALNAYEATGPGTFDWTVRARTVGADDSLGAPTLISDRRALWTPPEISGLDAAVNALVTNAAGDAVLTAYAETAETDDHPESVVATAFVRESGTWSEHVLEPRDDLELLSSAQFVPRAALEDDGTATVVWSTIRPGSSDRDLQVTRRARGGAWAPAVTLSEPAGNAFTFVVASGGDGPPVASWIEFTAAGGELFGAALGGTVDQAPVASFDVAPGTPVAGQVVTFTSTSTDDGTITDTRWDLDDDGSFDDVVGTTAQATFSEAGQYTVELQVTDDRGETATAAREITVTAAPSQGGGGGGTPAPGAEAPPSGAAPGPAPGGGGSPPPVVVTPPAPFGFVVAGTRATTASRAMPAVVGRALDDAHAKVLRGVVYADIRSDRVIRDAADLPKRPGGGRWKVGDVIGQTPAAKSTHATSTTAQLAVRLQYWAGEKGDRSHCRTLRAAMKKDDLDLALAQLRAAGCGSSPDLVLVPSKTAADPVVKSIAKDGDVTVTVPTDQSKLDLVTWKTSGVLSSGDPGPVADDFSLTVGLPNTFGILLRDRAGRRVQGAKVRIDLHEVGGSDTTRQTNADGVTAATVTPRRAGVIHVLSEWADASGERIYGYASFTVKDRGTTGFTTVTGRPYAWSRQLKRFVRSSAPQARAAGLPEFFAAVASCLKAFGGQVAQLGGSVTEQVVGATQRFQVSILQLARGTGRGTPQAAGVSTVTGGLWRILPNGVVAAGGGNVVSAGGANVVAAGGANVVAAGGLNLISDNGLGVISAGGGNLITLPDGARVVSAGGANVVSAGGLNLLSDNGLGVVAAGGANVVAAGGLN